MEAGAVPGVRDVPGAEHLAEGPGAPDLPSALVVRVLQQLPPNEVACTACLVCKEWAEACSSPQHRTVRLSQPLPPHAARLVRYWEEGLPWLSFRGKLLAVSTAAASGCETNLEVAWALVRPCLIGELLPRHYASEFLRGSQEVRGSRDPYVLHVGRDVAALDPGAAAATRGHGHLLPWLLEHRCPLNPRRTLEAAAEHCDLAALRWAWERLASDGLGAEYGDDDEAKTRAATAEAAARSRTPDALDKLEWLLSLGDFSAGSSLSLGAASLGDLPRLQWLSDRGVAPDGAALVAALASPTAGVEVVEWLEQQGAGSVVEVWAPGVWVSPHKLEWLALRPGVQVEQEQWDEACVEAARAGDLPLVAHLHGARGAQLSSFVWTHAVASGSMELLTWLLSKDCQTYSGALQEAATRGDASLIAWMLRSSGCDLPYNPLRHLIQFWPKAAAPPRPPQGAAGPAVPPQHEEDGGAAGERSELLRAVQLLVDEGAEVGRSSDAASAAVSRGDLPLVELLASLGCTPGGDALSLAADAGCAELLRWVVERGCAMEYAANAYAAAGRNGDSDTLGALLQLGVPAGDKELRAVQQRCPPAVLRTLLAYQAELAEQDEDGGDGADD